MPNLRSNALTVKRLLTECRRKYKEELDKCKMAKNTFVPNLENKPNNYYFYSQGKSNRKYLGNLKKKTNLVSHKIVQN